MAAKSWKVMALIVWTSLVQLPIHSAAFADEIDPYLVELILGQETLPSDVWVSPTQVALLLPKLAGRLPSTFLSPRERAMFQQSLRRFFSINSTHRSVAPLLLRCLTICPPDIQLETIRIVSGNVASEPVWRLLLTLASSSAASFDVRSAAVRTLSEVRDTPEIFRALISIRDTDPNHRVRNEVGAVLRETTSTSVVRESGHSDHLEPPPDLVDRIMANLHPGESLPARSRPPRPTQQPDPNFHLDLFEIVFSDPRERVRSEQDFGALGYARRVLGLVESGTFRPSPAADWERWTLEQLRTSRSDILTQSILRANQRAAERGMPFSDTYREFLLGIIAPLPSSTPGHPLTIYHDVVRDAAVDSLVATHPGPELVSRHRVRYLQWLSPALRTEALELERLFSLRTGPREPTEQRARDASEVVLGYLDLLRVERRIQSTSSRRCSLPEIARRRGIGGNN